MRGRRVAGENVQERVPGSAQCLHRRMRCARRIGCLAGLTGLRGPRLSSTGLGCGGRLTGLCGGCLSLSIRLCMSARRSGLGCLLRLDGLLRCCRCGRLSSITLLARLHGLLRLSRQRSTLRGGVRRHRSRSPRRRPATGCWGVFSDIEILSYGVWKQHLPAESASTGGITLVFRDRTLQPYRIEL